MKYNNYGRSNTNFLRENKDFELILFFFINKEKDKIEMTIKTNYNIVPKNDQKKIKEYDFSPKNLERSNFYIEITMNNR